MAGVGAPAEKQELLWDKLDRLLREAESAQAKLRGGGTHALHHAQATLLHTLGNPALGYWQLPPERQQALVVRMSPLVRRIGDAVNPRATLENLLCLWRHPHPFEEMVRAVKVGVPVERLLEPGELVYKAVTGWLGNFIGWSSNSDVPLGFYFWSGVMALSAACRYGWFIDRQVENLRMNHYILMVGKKATGKSSGLNAATELLHRCNYQINPWHRELAPKEDTFKEGNHPWHVLLLPEDTNQETLVSTLASREQTLQWPEGIPIPADPPATLMTEATGLLGLDELATFLGRQGWNIEKRIPWLTTMYGRPDYVYKTKSGGEQRLHNIALSLLGCCTPDWMKVAISPLLFGGGFLDRCVVVHREPLISRTYPTAEPRDPVTANYLARYLKELSCRLRPEELYAVPQALDWFNNWYREFPESSDDQDTSAKRTANHLWKLAGVLALSDQTQPHIHLKHFELAWRIMSQEDAHYREFLGYIRRPTELDNMEFIERKLFKAGAFGLDPETNEPAFMLQSELFNHLRQRQGLSPPNPKALPFLDSLQQAGRIEKLAGVGRGKGRKGIGYRLVDSVAMDWQRREGVVDDTRWVSQRSVPQE